MIALCVAIASQPTNNKKEPTSRQKDPTGQGKNRKRGSVALKTRLTDSQRKIIRLFNGIPRTRKVRTDIRNEVEKTTVYEYEITAAESLALSSSVGFILNDALLESQLDPPPNWYWRTIIERSYASGTAEEVVIFNQLINSAGVKAPTTGFPLAEIQVQDVLLSNEYREALARVLADNTNSIRTLSKGTADQVMTQINLGINAGDSPRVISQAIQDRFNVARSNADRTARTEINKAYTDAKMDMGDIAMDRTGLRAGVIHVSALIPTTRKTHAARHGNAYTTAQQRQWWNKGANRINCLCDVISVLIDRFGNIVDTQLQRRIQEERAFFDQ